MQTSKPPEETTDPRLIEHQVILDGIELIRRMVRAEEPWCESDVRDWVRRAQESLRAKAT